MLRSICGDALNPFGRPSRLALKSLGANAVRIQARDDPRYFSYAAYLRKNGFEVIVVLDKDSFASTDYGRETAQYMEQFVPDLLVIGNEEDAWIMEEEGVPSPSSWAMKPAEYADFFTACSASTTAPTCVGGLVSGVPELVADYLQAISAVSRDWVHGIDIHPYGKNAEQAVWLLGEYQKYLSPGICMYTLEWNRPYKEISVFVPALESVVWGHSWFCYSQGQVDGFGLLSVSGSKRKAWHALRNLYKA